MKRTTILADEALLLETKQLAEETGRSFTEIVHEALRDYLKTHRRQRKPISFAGIGRSGRTDVSEAAEEILREDSDKAAGWS